LEKFSLTGGYGWRVPPAVTCPKIIAMNVVLNPQMGPIKEGFGRKFLKGRIGPQKG